MTCAPANISVSGHPGVPASARRTRRGFTLIEILCVVVIIGLAAGIIGCTQLWCCYSCLLPMAIGIFTIIVLSLSNTRNYLRVSAAARESAPPA